MRIQAETELPVGQLLTVSDVCRELSISKATLYRIRGKDDSVPDPIYITPRTPRWSRDALDHWLDTRRPQVELHVRPGLLGGRKTRRPSRNTSRSLYLQGASSVYADAQ